MSSEIQKAGEFQSLEQTVVRGASDPTFDVGKLERLVALMERREAQQREQEFDEAMNRVQRNVTPVAQNGLMDRGAGKGQIPYARREDVEAMVRPLYLEEGFSVSYDAPMAADGGKIQVRMNVSRRGHTRRFEITFSPDSSGGKTGPQGTISSISYAQRELTMMAWNVVAKGLDRNGAGDKDVTVIESLQANEIRTRMNNLPQSKPGFLLGKLCDKYGVTTPEALTISQLDSAMKDVAATEANKKAQ